MAALSKVIRVISGTLGELPIKADGGTFKPSGYKRETADAEVAENIGFTETPTAAVLKLKLNSVVDPQQFARINNDTLTIYLANGTEHVMSNAWAMDMPELGKGEYDIEFQSAKSQKLK